MKSEAMVATLRITKALSDMQRLRILMMLRDGELCVCQIIEVLGLAPSTVSKHLSILSNARLVGFRKEGRWAYYRLPSGAALKRVTPLLKWLDTSLENERLIAEDARKLQVALACSPESLSGRQRKRSEKQQST